MEVLLGILAAFFFSITFVMNQFISSSGGDWLWTAALRFLFMFVLLLPYVLRKGRMQRVLNKIKEQPKSWLLWSQIGFGLFYMMISFASTLVPGWLVASTWQITIVAGSILAPLLVKDPKEKQLSRMSGSDFLCFLVIIAGIVLAESEQFTAVSLKSSVIGFCAVLIAAIGYPLGNRKIMMINHGENQLNTIERVFAMTLCSLPVWFVCSGVGLLRSGPPSSSQLLSSFVVAVFSGIIATLLFFHGTQMVHHQAKRLATVEATQSLEVLFSLLLSVIVLDQSLPGTAGLVGLGMIIVGMCAKVLK